MKTTTNWDDNFLNLPKIKFQGKDYIFINGAIATQEAYNHFEPSYAHLCPDGKILRYGVQIGIKEDIEFL